MEEILITKEERADYNAVELIKCHDCINDFGHWCYQRGKQEGVSLESIFEEQGTHPNFIRRAQYIHQAAEKYKGAFCEPHFQKNKTTILLNKIKTGAIRFLSRYGKKLIK